MALREAHSGSTVSNQAGPVGSKSSVGDIKGLGKKERDRRRRNKKREVRKAFKAVAGADLRREVETLSETVTEQSRIIKDMRDLLLRAWGVDDAAKFRGVFLGNLGQERDLRKEVFASVTEEARRRMAVRQARREMLVEVTYVVAEREERRDRWRQMEGEMILEVRRRRVRRFTQEKQAQQAQQREADRRRREAFTAEEQQRRLAAEDLRRQEGQKIDGAVQEKVSRAWGSKAINAHRRAMKKDRRAKAVEKEKRVVDLGGGASWSILPTGAMVISRAW